MSLNDQHAVRLILLSVLLISGIITAWRASGGRSVTLAEAALKLGLSPLSGGRDRLLQSYGFINRLQYGHKQHAGQVFQGQYRGHAVTALDMRYEATCMTPRDCPEYYSFLFLELPAPLPEITIYREGLVSRLVQKAGHGDIDFESHEFSRTFRVRAAEPRYAYDVCNARMIEYLLENTDLSIEIEKSTLCISFEDVLKPESLRRNLDRLSDLRERIPNYLFG